MAPRESFVQTLDVQSTLQVCGRDDDVVGVPVGFMQGALMHQTVYCLEGMHSERVSYTSELIKYAAVVNMVIA